MTRSKVVGLGEVLWDILPGQKQVGGAPANFAYISSVLGDIGLIASRIGADDLGAEMQSQLRSRGLNTDYIQKDSEHATGTVNVHLRSDGQPLFEITEPSAWDFLEWTAEWDALARAADAVCFGSLAQRNPRSRATIRRFLSATAKDTIRVFDMNLRQHYYSQGILAESIASAQIVKLNDEEVLIASRLFQAPSNDCLPFAQWLQRRFQLRLVCVTFGAEGSLLVSESSHHRHPGYRVKVTDTVGAGDAFTAAMLHHFLRGSTIAAINAAANRMGSLVASEAGAMPALSSEGIKEVRA
jgi:fructokinase